MYSTEVEERSTEEIKGEGIKTVLCLKGGSVSRDKDMIKCITALLTAILHLSEHPHTSYVLTSLTIECISHPMAM